MSILGGFLTDLLGERKAGRTGGGKAKSTTEKSAKTREGRNSLATGAKSRETRTPVSDEEVASTTTTTSKEKVSLGRLNAAHALVNGKPNGSLNSTVGQLRAYMDAAKDGKNISAAASALMGIANKGLNEESIAALNEILDVKVSAAEIMSAVRKAEEAPAEGADTPSTDPTQETPSDTADSAPDQPAETPSDTAETAPDEPAPAPSETATP